MTTPVFNNPIKKGYSETRAYYKVNTAFTGASIGDILEKIIVKDLSGSNTNQSSVTVVATYYININTSQTLQESEVSASNVDFIGMGVGGGSSSTAEFVRITNGASLTVAVKGTGSTATTSDGSLVVQESPNSRLITGLGVNDFSTYRNATLSSTASVVQATTTRIYGISFLNSNSSQVFVKMYNTATPTVGTTTPVRTFSISQTSSFFLPVAFTPQHFFSTALSIACVAGIADNSNTAPTTPIIAEIAYV